MKTRIQTNGMNRHLPPALSNPGDTSAVVNLRKRSGSLCPIGSPQSLYTLHENSRHLICIHTCYDGEHHITEDVQGIYYEALVESTTGNIQSLSTCIFEKEIGVTILSTRTIGNTLIIFSAEHIYYLLYKEGAYIFLGERPEIPIFSFFPESLYPINYPVEAHDFTKNYTDPTRIDFADTQFYDSTYYAAFFQLQEMAWEEHRFIQPILVRYAITLYDGSRIYASAPIMVGNPNEPLQPYEINLPMRSSNTVCFGTIAWNIIAHTYRLKCKIHDIALNNWKDVIRSIDIFVAPEVTIFEPDLHIDDNWLSYSIIKGENNLGNPSYRLVGKPYFNLKEVHKRYLESSLFYKIASLDNWDELQPDAEFVVKCEVRPDQLVHEEVLSVDNTSLLSTGAKISYIYNKRLHIANLTKQLFPGFPIGLYNIGNNNSPCSAEVYIRTYLKSERGESEVVWHGETNHFYNLLSPLIGYPDSNAYKMEIVAQTANTRYSAILNLTPSKYEGRAEYLDSDLLPVTLHAETINGPLNIPLPLNNSYTQPNVLRVSEYENPFIFPVELTYTISNSAITGIASITSALSEGQFGEFSLYLFTEEGIWALQNGEGAVCYETQHQLNRISISPDYPIIPLETAILFITNKGIFSIQGAIVQEVWSFDEAAYESTTPIIQHGSDASLTAILSDTTRLPNFFQGCRVVYNSTEKELICSHPDASYTLIIHLPTLHIYRSNRLYTHIYSDEAHLLGQNETEKIYDLQQEIPTPQTIAWVSRPITLNTECYQRWREVCWRMAMQQGTMRLSIWGGNDAEGEFNLVAQGDFTGTIPGQLLMRQATPPYKYFRLIVTGSVSPDFHLTAIDVSAGITIDNRLR